MVQHQRSRLLACAALPEDQHADVRMVRELPDHAADFDHGGAVSGQRRIGQRGVAAHQRPRLGRPCFRPLVMSDMPHRSSKKGIVLQMTVGVSRRIQQRGIGRHRRRKDVLHAQAGADGRLKRQLPHIRRQRLQRSGIDRRGGRQRADPAERRPLSRQRTDRPSQPRRVAAQRDTQDQDASVFLGLFQRLRQPRLADAAHRGIGIRQQRQCRAVRVGVPLRIPASENQCACFLHVPSRPVKKSTVLKKRSYRTNRR